MVKIWPKFWRYVDIQFTLWHEVFHFLKKNLRRCKNVVNISDQNLTCGKKMFQNLTCCKNSDSENDVLFKVDWKSEKFWNSWFKVWRVVKTCFKIWFFSKFFIQKLHFFHFFSISWFLRKQKTAEVGALRDKKFQKRFSASKTSIKICFFLQSKITSKADPLSNLFVRNLADSKIFYSKLSSCKKWL